MKTAQYIDGVGQVHFINGMIRMDMIVLEPRQGEEAPIPADAGQIVMTPQGFLTMLGSMQQLADKLAEAGIFQTVEKQ